MPTGTPVEDTAALLRELAAEVAKLPEVTHYQAYAGLAAPISFNGLVRQYYLRAGGEVGDLQVNLVDKSQRHRKSHEIAQAVRPALEKIAKARGADIKVVEVPPGPPVLSPIVAEIYGPDYDAQMALAKQVRGVFEQTAGPDRDRRHRPRPGAAHRAARRHRQGGAERHSGRGGRARRAARARRRGHHADPRRPEQVHGAGARRPALLRARLARRDAEAQGARPGREGPDLRGGAGGTRRAADPAARARHPPQGPAAGRLRDGRRRRRRRQDRLAAVRRVRRARGARADQGAGQPRGGRALDLRAVGPLLEVLAEVGRRVADHVRDVPRHGHRVRRGPDPDLPAGRRAVPLVPDAADHHGADPADDHRRAAGPRAVRRAVHRDVDDRDDRARRHHRAQLDPAGRLHPPAARRRRELSSRR